MAHYRHVNGILCVIQCMTYQYIYMEFNFIMSYEFRSIS